MSMIIAAMPAHNEEGTIAKVVLSAANNFFSKEKTLTKREDWIKDV